MRNNLEKENKKMEMEGKEICYTCNGAGRVEDFTGTGTMGCPRCQGTGYLIKHPLSTYNDWLD
jgi:DnaJ-class molecular chaperone